MEEMVLLTIITRSKGSARQMRPTPNPSQRGREKGGWDYAGCGTPLLGGAGGGSPRAESPLHDPIPSVSFTTHLRIFT